MLTEQYIKNNYKDIVADDYLVQPFYEDKFLFSRNKKTCVVCYNEYENRMNYSLWKLLVVQEEFDGFKCCVLDSYYAMPNNKGVWVNDNVFCVTYLKNPSLPELALEYLDFSTFKRFRIPIYPKQIHDTQLVKNKHFIYEAKPIPVVYIDPYKQAYEEYLPGAKWEDIVVQKTKVIK